MKKTILMTSLLATLISGTVLADNSVYPDANPYFSNGVYIGIQGGALFGRGYAQGAAQADLGYQFTQNFAIEANVATPISNSVDGAFSSAYAKFLIPFQDKPVAFYLKGGATLIGTKLLGYRFHFILPSAGAGVQYALTKHIALDAGYTNIGGSINLASAGLTFRFA